MSGKISLLKEWSGFGTGCPGSWWSHHPWRHSKTVWMWQFRTWFSRHGGVGLAVGLDDLRGLFQPQSFCKKTYLTWKSRQFPGTVQNLWATQCYWGAAPLLQPSRATFLPTAAKTATLREGTLSSAMQDKQGKTVDRGKTVELESAV